MCKVNKLIRVLLLLLMSVAGNGYAQNTEAELMTLFTTAQERELIDNNRYKTQQVETSVVAVEQTPDEGEEEIKEQEFTLTVRLTGVTISQSGQNVAWVNGDAYENGTKLDDGSTVYISTKLSSLVQIKPPDGKYHPVVAGETVDISYYRIIEG